MATKLIKFQDGGYNSGAEGADTLVLGTDTSLGQYPSTAAGMTAGRTTIEAAAVTSVGISGHARFGRSVLALFASDPRQWRIDRAAGTFPVKAQGITKIGQYSSSTVKFYDSNGTTVLHAMGGQVTDNSAGPSDLQINTDGSYGAVDRADAGVNITTTGDHFFVGVDHTSGFACRLAVVEYSDGLDATRTGFRVVSGYPAVGAVPINTILTPPLVLQAITGSGADTSNGDGTTVTIGVDIVLTGAQVVSGGTAVQSGGLVTFSSLILRPVTSLLGTLARPAAAGLATFADLRLRFQ